MKRLFPVNRAIRKSLILPSISPSRIGAQVFTSRYSSVCELLDPCGLALIVPVGEHEAHTDQATHTRMKAGPHNVSDQQRFLTNNGSIRQNSANKMLHSVALRGFDVNLL